MNNQEALNTLISAVRVATKRGAFELDETEAIKKAVDVFTKPPEAPKEEKPTKKEVEKKAEKKKDETAK